MDEVHALIYVDEVRALTDSIIRVFCCFDYGW